MPEKPRDPQEPADTLELLDDDAPAGGRPQTIPLAAALPPARPPRVPDPGRPASPRSADDDEASAAGDAPRFRGLHCGYPIPEGGALRCNECGRTYTVETLEHWFGGDEQQRFDHVHWMVVATLFTMLLMPLPGIGGFGRASAGIALAWASHLANRGRQGSTGGYYAIAGMFIGIVMFLVFSWRLEGISDDLAFYTLHMIGGCVLLLAMLSDPQGGDVAGAAFSKRLAPIILFATPVFAGACWLLDALFANIVAGAAGGGGGGIPIGPPGGGPGGPGGLANLFASLAKYLPAPFGIILPFLAAAAVWLFVWRTLAGMRRTLFGAAGESV